MSQEFKAPWERPEIQVITSIIGGVVTKVEQINTVKADEDVEDIPR